jgi:monoamine oxidase
LWTPYPLREPIVVLWRGGPGARRLAELPAGEREARALARPLRRTLFFAGEAANTEGGTGTVDGAITSGRHAARQVLRAL